MRDAVGALRRFRAFTPAPLRRQVSAGLATVRARRLEARLAQLAAGSKRIVVGPWLGEVGFELLYWVPFLRWFAARYRVAPERLVVVSRGGTADWYRPFAGAYRDAFDALSPDAFFRLHQERVTANGEQKQNQVLESERALLRQLTPDLDERAMLHPASMYGLFAPFWWGHVGESWVQRFLRFEPITGAPPPAFVPTDRPYTAVKFYFNESFPATPENRRFVRSRLEALRAEGPVVSLATRLQLDDHQDEHPVAGVIGLPDDIGAAENLGVQSRIVAGAARFEGTYGGFSYLAPMAGVPARAWFSDAGGFSRTHLTLAQHAIGGLGGQRLDVCEAPGGARLS